MDGVVVSGNSPYAYLQLLSHRGKQPFHGLEARRDLTALYPTYGRLISPSSQGQTLLADAVAFAGMPEQGADVHALIMPYQAFPLELRRRE